MKVTNKQLLDLFGLKVGDKIKFGENSVIFDVVESGYGIALRRKYVVGEIPITMFLNREFEIIKPKPKLTDDEKVILKNIDKEYEWVAREKEVDLTLFVDKPEKANGYWWTNNPNYSEFQAFNHLFNFITWEDKEPWNIKELLDERD